MDTKQAIDFLQDVADDTPDSEWKTWLSEAIAVLRKATQWQPMETAPAHPDTHFFAVRGFDRKVVLCSRDDFDRDWFRDKYADDTRHASEFLGWQPFPTFF